MARVLTQARGALSRIKSRLLSRPRARLAPQATAEGIALWTETAAREFGVRSAIHPEDHIYNFVMAHPGFQSDRHRVRYYFEDGARSAEQFAAIVSRHHNAEAPSVLEFASGYGCVSRHLGANFDLVCCDIHPAAHAFLQQSLGLQSILSTSIPDDFDTGRHFDVVFALSFFSHMPSRTWRRWLAQLATQVSPGGLLVFTTHGELSRAHFDNPVIPESGFWFRADSEQKDLPTAEYGQTIVTPGFVRGSIAGIPGATLVEEVGAGWWGHQDVFVVRMNGSAPG